MVIPKYTYLKVFTPFVKTPCIQLLVQLFLVYLCISIAFIYRTISINLHCIYKSPNRVCARYM